MKSFTIAAFLAASALANITSFEQDFITYVVNHGKSYATKEEYEYRLSIFSEKSVEINRLNSMNGSATYGHNQFSDMSGEEIKKSLGDSDHIDIPYSSVISFPKADASAVDWRAKGAVHAIKNQGHCGSCWAFSAVSVMESAHFLATGNMPSLSEQELVDCEPKSNGCNGGLSAYGFQYAMNVGMVSEDEYPYTAVTGTCNNSVLNGGVKVTDWQWVVRQSADELKNAIAKQPVSVSIQADQPVFHQYTSGIISGTDCGTSLDHAIVAVGYGSENGMDYYIVRNSWGTSWGENGYVRIAIEEGKGVCGIQVRPVIAQTE